MDRIALADSWSKSSRTILDLQACWAWSMSWETIRWEEADASFLGLGLNVGSHGTHEWLSCLEVTIQANFESRALLLYLALLKPRPPVAFEAQSLSQALQAKNFPSFSLGFHQNFLVSVSSLSQTEIGTLNEEMVYLGMVWATELMRVHLSPKTKFYFSILMVFFQAWLVKTKVLGRGLR